MKVLLVDDHALVRRGLRELLAESFPQAEFVEAETGEEALDFAGKLELDLVVLDVSLPGRGGIDALKEIVARSPKVPVLVLSQHPEEQYAVRALRAGAKGYITKSAAPEELVKAARKVLSGGTFVSEAAAERLAESVGQDHSRPLHAGLSDRELQVLRMIASGRSVKEIAGDLSLSEKTVSTYRARILEKLKMRTSAELMRYALRAGLVD